MEIWGKRMEGDGWRETKGWREIQGLTGRPGRMDVCEEGEEQTQQDGRLSWGCRLILQAGCLRADHTGGWSSEAQAGSADIELAV